MSAPTPVQARSPELDFCKGVLIALVVMFHITFIGQSRAAMIHLGLLAFSFHIPGFFLLSGYFLRWNRPAMQQIVLAWRRVIVPYLVFEPIYLAILQLLQHRGFSVSTVPPVGARAWLETLVVHPLGAFWYLHDLGIALVIWAVCAAATRRRGATPLIAVILFGAALLALSLTGVIQFYNMSYVILGAILGMTGIAIPGSMWFAVPTALVIWRFGVGIERGTSESLVLCVSIIGMLAGVYAGLGNRALGRVIVYIGRNSLGVMVFHPFVINAFKPLARFFLRADPSGLAYVVAIVLTALAGSLFAMALLDRAHISPWLFGHNAYSPYTPGLERQATTRIPQSSYL